MHFSGNVRVTGKRLAQNGTSMLTIELLAVSVRAGGTSAELCGFVDSLIRGPSGTWTSLLLGSCWVSCGVAACCSVATMTDAAGQLETVQCLRDTDELWPTHGHGYRWAHWLVGLSITSLHRGRPFRNTMVAVQGSCENLPRLSCDSSS